MYQTPDKQREEIETRFSYHEGTPVQGDRVPWLASQTDVLAQDWRTVE